MYKRVIRSEGLYGKFREFRKAIDGLDDLAKRKGLVPARSYALEFGRANVAIAEWEYADLAQYERDRKTFLQDEELRNAWQATIPYIVQGSHYTKNSGLRWGGRKPKQHCIGLNTTLSDFRCSPSAKTVVRPRRSSKAATQLKVKSTLSETRLEQRVGGICHTNGIHPGFLAEARGLYQHSHPFFEQLHLVVEGLHLIHVLL